MTDWRNIPSAADWGRSGLTGRARAVARAAAEAVLAKAGRGDELVAPASGWVDRIVDDYDHTLGQASRPIRMGVNALLVGFDVLPVAVAGGLSPLRRRSLTDRLQFLERVENHRLGALTMAWIAIKVPLLMSAFEEGEPLAETGFDRPSTTSRRLPIHPPTETSP